MINIVSLMGRLVADPEIRTTNSGISCASFRVVVDRDYQKEGEERQADFIPCIAWRQTADFIKKYFTKGKMIAIVGSLQSRNYEDKTGAKRTAYEVIVDKVSFCGSKDTNESTAEENTAEENTAEEELNDDGLPF